MKVPHPKSALKLFALAVLLFPGAEVFGATVFWGNSNIGNWNQSTNWIGGVLPTWEEDEARISNGGIAVIDATQDISVGLLTVAHSAGSSGTLRVTGGNLFTHAPMCIGGKTATEGGTGLLEQSGGSVVLNENGAEMIVGFGSTAIGAYNMSGGSLRISGDWVSLVLGNARSFGTVNQSGGKVLITGRESRLQFGADNGLNGNVLRTDGSGTYNLSGGTFAAGFLLFGTFFSTTGIGTNTFNLSGTGVLKVGTIGVMEGGINSSNYFNFTGGTLTASNTQISLRNSGGVLEAAGLQLDEGGLTDTDNIITWNPYTLTFAGSSYIQEAAGTLAIDIDPDRNDLLDIGAGSDIGTATIAGTIIVRLLNSYLEFTTNDPPIGATYDIVVADSISNSANVIGRTPRGYSFVPSIVVGGDGRQVLRLTVAAPAPKLKQPRALGDNLFEFSFTNLPGVPFTALRTTNIVSPSVDWTVLGPVTESPPGQFRFSDLRNTNVVQRFYRVRSP